ncbi:MAG: DUF192 domain-containing protein [Sideroxyarcus sp.]|nr:DUF192 domain-containing protein [Sideroxyarcus sp.]
MHKSIPMSRVILVLVLTLLIFGGFFAALFFDDLKQETQFVWTDARKVILPLPKGTVTIGEHSYAVEIAEKDTTRERGLMYRRSLRADHGMLFLFPEAGLHGIWMKNVSMRLDLMWISDDVVVHIEKSVPPAIGAEQPPVYIPESPANMVLELAGGTAERDGFAIGSPVTVQRNTEAVQGR